jgi:hypothetical protein
MNANVMDSRPAVSIAQFLDLLRGSVDTANSAYIAASEHCQPESPANREFDRNAVQPRQPMADCRRSVARGFPEDYRLHTRKCLAKNHEIPTKPLPPYQPTDMSPPQADRLTGPRDLVVPLNVSGR